MTAAQPEPAPASTVVPGDVLPGLPEDALATLPRSAGRSPCSAEAKASSKNGSALLNFGGCARRIGPLDFVWAATNAAGTASTTARYAATARRYEDIRRLPK